MGFTDKEPGLVLVAWEISPVSPGKPVKASVCGQLFAPQSNVPSEMHKRSCTRDDQI